MATDNIVRVVFEAYTDKLKRGLQDVNDSLSGMEGSGKRVGKSFKFQDAQNGAKTLSSGIKSASEQTNKLGQEGAKAGKN